MYNKILSGDFLMKILIVEDEKELAKNLSTLLTAENFIVKTEYNGNKALDVIFAENFDIIILDIMLPELDGLKIIKALRKEHIKTPVIMLTAKNDIADKVKGLDAGADDYIVKPFSTSELIARIRAVLRRFRDDMSEIVEIDDLKINIETKEIFYNNNKMDLTKKEYSIVELLALNRNKPVSKYDIAEHVWGDTYDLIATSNFVEVHIKNIRKKFSKFTDKHIIETERGFGYKIS